MSLLSEIRDIGNSTNDLKKFGLTLGAAFGILAGFLFWKHAGSVTVFAGISVVFLLCAFVYPLVLKPVQKAWMTAALLMGWVMTRVILTALFYVAITPIGMILRLMGKDILDQNFDPKKQSYWQIRPQASRTPSDYEKQY